MTHEEVKQAVQDLSKGVLPVTVLAGIASLIFIAGMSYHNITSSSATAAEQITAIRSEISSLAKSVQDMSSQIRDIPKNPIQRGDIVQLCRTLERINKGFRCPDSL